MFEEMDPRGLIFCELELAYLSLGTLHDRIFLYLLELLHSLIIPFNILVLQQIWYGFGNLYEI